MAKSALDAAGIDAAVLGDDAGGLYPGLWEGRGVVVVVHADDARAARDILDIPAAPID